MEAMDKPVLCSVLCYVPAQLHLGPGCESVQLAPRDQHQAGDVQELPGEAAAAGPHQVALPGDEEEGQGDRPMMLVLGN